jgi:hypothetical protein
MLAPMLANLVYRRHGASDGFIPLPDEFRERERGDFEMADELWADGKTPPIREGVLELFRQFIRDARDCGVDVVMVVGPRLDRTKAELAALEALGALAREENTRLLCLDERQQPVFRRRSLYRDPAHLNGKGAELLTRMIAAHLKTIPMFEHSAPLARIQREDAVRRR